MSKLVPLRHGCVILRIRISHAATAFLGRECVRYRNELATSDTLEVLAVVTELPEMSLNFFMLLLIESKLLHFSTFDGIFIPQRPQNPGSPDVRFVGSFSLN